MDASVHHEYGRLTLATAGLLLFQWFHKLTSDFSKSPISRIYTVTCIRLANWAVRTALVDAVVTAAHAAAAAAAAVTLWMEMQRQVAADSHRVADG